MSGWREGETQGRGVVSSLGERETLISGSECMYPDERAQSRSGSGRGTGIE